MSEGETLFRMEIYKRRRNKSGSDSRNSTSRFTASGGQSKKFATASRRLQAYFILRLEQVRFGPG
jgi:hypothetical protein